MLVRGRFQFAIDEVTSIGERAQVRIGEVMGLRERILGCAQRVEL
jgi:hypothetical protein